MATLQLQDNQQDTLAIQAVDEAGQAVTLPPGAVSWTNSNPSVASISPSTDGMSASIVATGTALGATQIGVSADIGTGTPLTGQLDVTVVAGAAASIQIVPGTPVSK